MITATALILGKKYTATGETPSEAIANLQPGNVKGKVILTISQDGVSRERVIMPFAAMKLFNTAGLSREIALKHIAAIFPAAPATAEQPNAVAKPKRVVRRRKPAK